MQPYRAPQKISPQQSQVCADNSLKLSGDLVIAIQKVLEI